MSELVIKIFQLFGDGQLPITKDTTMAELKKLPFDILDIITVVIIVQVIHKVDIPDALMEMPELTIEGFVWEVSKLPRQTDELFKAHTVKLYVDWMGHRAFRWDHQLN